MVFERYVGVSCDYEPAGWHLVVRTLRGYLMKAGPPAVHFRRAAECCHDAWILGTEGHSVSVGLIFREAVSEMVRWILAITGLAALYRRWYRWRHPKPDCRDLDEETKYVIRLFMAELPVADIPGLSRVLLYGSRARGGHDRWSDVDLAVVLDGGDPGGNARSVMNDRLADLSCTIMCDTDYRFQVVAFVIWEDDLSHPEKRASPFFYRNVLADRVELTLTGHGHS